MEISNPLLPKGPSLLTDLSLYPPAPLPRRSPSAFYSSSSSLVVVVVLLLSFSFFFTATCPKAATKIETGSKRAKAEVGFTSYRLLFFSINKFMEPF
jgi:hypothetical protein